jgi:hypothetical protein
MNYASMIARRIVRLAAPGVFLCLLMAPAHAQQSSKKAYSFRGKVEQVNPSPKPLTVTNEPIEAGWAP